jgi:hypothetical protein
MKFAVLLPTGVSVRNFGLGSFLEQLADHGEVRVWCGVQPEQPERGERGGGVLWHPLLPYDGGPTASILQCSIGYAHLYHARTVAMRQHLRKRTSTTWRGRAKHGVARVVGKALASPGGIAALEHAHARTATRAQAVDYFRGVFREWTPSIVFSADQRPLDVLAPVLAARQLAIPTATFIFSWDNLTSKSRMAAAFDHYLVWSRHMGHDLQRIYSGISEHAIHIVGSPQFDCYSDKSLLWSRTEFFERACGDPDKPLVCYSGGDTTTCPEDPQHVDVLMRLVASGQVRRQPQVLLRPAPVDAGGRYEEVRTRHPALIVAQPRWSNAKRHDWMRVVPSREDVQFLANLTYHADVNVNVASTMTLDFAIRNKPVINIAFDVASPPPFGTTLWDWHYQKEHYQPVIELGAARIARSTAELAAEINESLTNPGEREESRRKLVDLELGVPVGQSGTRIVEVLSAIASGVAA